MATSPSVNGEQQPAEEMDRRRIGDIVAESLQEDDSFKYSFEYFPPKTTRGESFSTLADFPGMIILVFFSSQSPRPCFPDLFQTLIYPVFRVYVLRLSFWPDPMGFSFFFPSPVYLLLLLQGLRISICDGWTWRDRRRSSRTSPGVQGGRRARPRCR